MVVSAQLFKSVHCTTNPGEVPDVFVTVTTACVACTVTDRAAVSVSGEGAVAVPQQNRHGRSTRPCIYPWEQMRLIAPVISQSDVLQHYQESGEEEGPEGQALTGGIYNVPKCLHDPRAGYQASLPFFGLGRKASFRMPDSREFTSPVNSVRLQQAVVA
jgi:hypothetical protein